MNEVKTDIDKLLDSKAIEVINSIKQDITTVVKNKLYEISLTEVNTNKFLSDIISDSISEEFKVQVKKNLIKELSGKHTEGGKHQSGKHTETPKKRTRKATDSKTTE